MTVKISISLTDDLHEAVKTIAEQSGTTVSGFFADLAQQRIDADRASTEQLHRLNGPARQADPDAYEQRRAEFLQRANAAKEAAARKAAQLRGSDAA